MDWKCGLITGAAGFVIENGRKSAGQRFGPGVYRGQHQSQSKRRATSGVRRRRRRPPERHSAAVLAAAFGVLFIGVSARPSAACAVATFSERRTYVDGNSGGCKSHSFAPFSTVFISIDSSWRGLHFISCVQVDTSSRLTTNSRRTPVSWRFSSSPARFPRAFAAEHSLGSTWTQKTFYRAFQELPNGMFICWIGQKTTEIKINLLTSSTLLRSPLVTSKHVKTEWNSGQLNWFTTLKKSNRSHAISWIP